MHDLELNYAARDFYYIPIQMTSANRDVKPHRRSGDHAFRRIYLTFIGKPLIRSLLLDLLVFEISTCIRAMLLNILNIRGEEVCTIY